MPPRLRITKITYVVKSGAKKAAKAALFFGVNADVTPTADQSYRE